MESNFASLIDHQETHHARILVVDDMQINREILTSMLTPSYQVFTACNGNEAVAFSMRHRPDLIIMDVEMPEMDGLQACQKLRSMPETAETPVIFATSLKSVEDENACWQSGGTDFMHKPLNSTTVKNRVKQQIIRKFRSDMLKELAFMDDLTQQYSRRFLEDTLPREYGLAKRNNTLLSVLMIDIDYFKKYNDLYGRENGDDCLKQVASSIVNCTHRPTDTVVRYAGEKFCCLLPQTDSHGAVTMAKSIQGAVSKLAIPHDSSDFNRVTVSIGVATTGDHMPGVVDLLAHADQHLLEAKQGGRNRWAN